MTLEYRWENAPYDTQRWEYLRVTDNSSSKIGEVWRIIRARQSYDEPVHEYKAWVFSLKLTRMFNTKDEAIAWVTACERME